MHPSAPRPDEAEVIVVGAGLAGLSCALLLERQGVGVHLLEAADDVGGRIRTDEKDGFLLDRGFQVMLTAYDELQSQVDLPRLDLKSFKPGSLVWNGESLEKMSDPWRNPAGALAAATARVGSFSDKLKVGNLRRKLVAKAPAQCFAGPDRSTQSELEELGFSQDFIDTFFRPFLGGVFLERELETTASLFRYYFRCFSVGDAAVPAKGMQRLPELLAMPLEERITLDCPVESVSGTSVRCAGGAEVRAERVVVAVDGSAAAVLLGTPAPAYKKTITSYYAAPEAPTTEPLLVLDGEGTGPANHVAVVSRVSPDYAPAGADLVSVSGVGAAAEDPRGFERGAPAQLRRWFGGTVDRWDHLATYVIPHALPRHPAGSVKVRGGAPVGPGGVIVAGDYTVFGALQGALLSGRRAAEMVLKSL